MASFWYTQAQLQAAGGLVVKELGSYKWQTIDEFQLKDHN